MESPQRKPLATRSNTISRLPMSSRLKRPRSPDGQPPTSDGKKSKTDLLKDSKPPFTTKGMKPSLSSSTLTKMNRMKNPAAEASKERLRRANSSTSVVKKPAKTVSATPGPGPGSFRFQPPQVQKAQTTFPSRAPQTTATTRNKAAATANNLNSTVVSTGAPKKRPAWDLKGRIQDMEDKQKREHQEKSSLRTQLTEYNDRIAQLENQNQQLNGDVVAKQMASDSAVKEISQLKEKLLKEQESSRKEKQQLEENVRNVEFEKSGIERRKVQLEGELSASMQEISGLRSSLAQLTSSQAVVQMQLDNTKIEHDKAMKEMAHLKQTLSERDALIEIQKTQIESLEKNSRDHETERRKLHNTIQELKGNIRVYCRVRPLLGDEALGTDVIPHISFPDMDGKVLELDKVSNVSINESMHNNMRGSKHEFNFDKVFPPESTQGQVFEEISQLVQSALDGYNVCIFAYGQTGSGKTHTMEGSLESEETLGMIPRSVQQIFQAASRLEAKGWKYDFKASMLEIYNETIQDLLSKKKDQKLEIKMTDKGESGEVYVNNLTIVDVSSEEKVLQLLQMSTENRAVAETKCNERSSRSHSVFQLQLLGSNDVTGETCKGTLSLVDLAGSERVKDSGSEGQRLLEAKKINKSLSDLGNVIMALGNQDKHVPYRNSKLTYLLKNSLGGNSKTLMFVNISPKEECFVESLNSLRFATKVNQCNIGTAQKKK